MNRAIPIAIAALLPACHPSGDRTFEVQESRVVHRDVQLGKSLIERFNADRSSSASDRDGGMPKFDWDLPEGWTEQPASQFRMASFASPGGGDCSISTAGGSLEMNVNRWRRQFGQEPLTQAEIDALPRTTLFARAQAMVVECEGDFSGMGGQTQPDAKLIGLVVPITPDRMLFVKFTGPRAEVDAQRDNFEALVDSLRFAERVDAPEPVGSNAGGGGLAWDAPSNWKQVPSKSSMRLVTFSPKSEPEVQCWVIVLASSAGGLANNVNRWRGEMQAPPLDDTAIADLPKIDVLGTEATLVEAYGDYTGQSGSVEAGGMLGLIALTGAESVFVKMVGPADGVRAAKADFVSFCRSLRAD
ncbi:MAG: hypothetical protein KDB80_12310 [Planctomycetes bacterium]|nr:hypothetical protein [Planctomycetota bacterium]